jgi:hypothetical protein
MLSPHTFGKTPAAEHLVRKLNEVGDDTARAIYIRSIGNAVKNCNSNLMGIRVAVHDFSMYVKVAANLLRLLREEANTLRVCEDNHINDLARNVIIGNIKRVIRELTVLRKIENVKTSIQKIKNKCAVDYYDDESASCSYMGHEIGEIFGDKFDSFCFPMVTDVVTPELLHQKSKMRRARKGIST